jgi:mono/diheme cytochrome c family protein
MHALTRLNLVLGMGVLVVGSAWAADYAPDKFLVAAIAKARADGAAGPNPVAGDAAAIAAGQATFATVCVACHGPAGAGDGPAAPALDPRPADLSNPAIWGYADPSVKHWIVMNGVKGTGMAPLGLSDQAAWSVLAYIDADLVKR